jgi:hypothetical protein
LNAIHYSNLSLIIFDENHTHIVSKYNRKTYNKKKLIKIKNKFNKYIFVYYEIVVFIRLLKIILIIIIYERPILFDLKLQNILVLNRIF